MNTFEVKSKSPEEYSPGYSDHFFQQYQLYLQMADNISDRRMSANKYFLSINTLLVGANSYFKAATAAPGLYFFAISIAGIVLCYVWYKLVLSYKNLNTAKFKVVHEIEQHLPLRLFDAEWDAVGRGKDKALYQPFSELELRVPHVFMALHGLVLLYLLF